MTLVSSLVSARMTPEAVAKLESAFPAKPALRTPIVGLPIAKDPVIEKRPATTTFKTPLVSDTVVRSTATDKGDPIAPSSNPTKSDPEPEKSKTWLWVTIILIIIILVILFIMWRRKKKKENGG